MIALQANTPVLMVLTTFPLCDYCVYNHILQTCSDSSLHIPRACILQHILVLRLAPALPAKIREMSTCCAGKWLVHQNAGNKLVIISLWCLLVASSWARKAGAVVRYEAQPLSINLWQQVCLIGLHVPIFLYHAGLAGMSNCDNCPCGQYSSFSGNT